MDKKLLMTSGAAIDTSDIPKSSDGALILKAKPMRTGDYEYLAFEIEGSHRRGYRFDDILIGRMEKPDVQECLSQFKALPVTDEHIFVPIGERKENACGTVLAEGKLKGKYVNTEAVIHEPKTIMKVTNGDATELSIGFYSSIEWVDNKEKGDPDFYIRDIDLNHLAVVRQGRAGPDARLSNHMAKRSKETLDMKKIMINGKEVEVSDEVAAFVEGLQGERDTLKENLATVTGERDLAQGQLASTKKELENKDKSVSDDAVKMANAHTQFVEDATKLGFDTSKLELGNYDAPKLKREILADNEVTLPDGASDAYVDGAWSVALANAKDTKKPAKDNKSKQTNSGSALDDIRPGSTKTVDDMEYDSRQKVHNSYFGGKKTKEG